MTGLTRARFEALAETYGGDVSRWPAQVREAAAVLMAAEPGFTGPVLASAAALDEALATWRTAPAGAALIGRVLAGAPQPRRWRWVSGAILAAGLAAAGVAGLMVGVSLPTSSGATAEVTMSNTVSLEGSDTLLEGLS